MDIRLEAVPQPIWPWQRHEGLPWPGLQFYHAPNALPLDNGGELPHWHLAWEQWGSIDNPPLIVFHALTGNSRLTHHRPHDPPGWWQGVVGPDLAIDTKQWHVIAANVLGGAMGSSSPSSQAGDGRPYGSRFPVMTLFDAARAMYQLMGQVTDGRRPVTVVGGSMGGMMALAYASLYPHQVAGVFAMGAPIAHLPWAIAYHAVGRAAIEHDPHFSGGDYYEREHGPDQGLALARMNDMISYRSPQAMWQKFGRQYQDDRQEMFKIESYLKYQGQKLVKRFDANSYLVLSRAMDQFALDDEAIRRLATVPVWLLAITGDMLYPASEIAYHAEQLQRAGVPTTLDYLPGRFGHDTFLLDQVGTGRWLSTGLGQVRKHILAKA